jgi:ribonuclease PH
VKYETGYLEWAEGSCLFEMGKTRVLCAASYEASVPRFLQGTGRGWVTAEYGMLPRATSERTQREASKGRPSGRTQEIQRLIGRSLRAVTNLQALKEGTIWIDCDVIQADGGTRTAAITGGYIALAVALRGLKEKGIVTGEVLRDSVAAISAGIVDGQPLLDLDYAEDSRAGVDFNVVMTGSGNLVEVQGTAEGEPFTRQQLDAMVSLASNGIEQLTALQREAAGA